MTAADRTLTALVLALVVAAPLVRPVWRAVDPGPADLLHACARLLAYEATDQWGEPWTLSPDVKSRPRGPSPLLAVGSKGPDGLTGTADDLEELWFGRPDEHGVIALFGRGPEARAWPYRSSPAVPISIALILLLTRWMSGFVDPRFVDPRASLAGRALAACALGVLPTLLLLGVLAAGGWTSLLRARPFHRLLSLEMGIVGSVYVLFAAAIFAHRDLHHLQKIEARERGG